MAASADLGGLGPKQGPATVFVWRLPNLLPLLLPWLAVLGLLALPSNRNAGAWWIWAPVIGLALVAVGLEAALEALDKQGFVPVVQVAACGSFGLAVVWLLGAGLARRCRALGIALMALAFAAVSLVAFVVGPLGEQMQDPLSFDTESLFMLLFAVLSGLVFAGALNVTGLRCRKRFGGMRVSFGLLLPLWPMWLVAGGVFVGAVALEAGGGPEWIEFLVGTLVLSLVSYGLILPFLILSFTCAFYRERLKCLLRLPATVPAATSAAPVAEQGTRQ